jgi:hypothetical protein
MLYIGITGSSTVYVSDLFSNTSLNAQSAATQSFYTWYVQDKTTKISTVFYQTPLFDNGYYTAFSFTNNGTFSAIGATNGNINLVGSQYSVIIYEMLNPYDLNISDSIGVLGNYILTIQGTSSATSTYTGNDSFTYSVYQN